MKKLELVKVIQEFENKTKRGIYECYFNYQKKVFVRHGNKIYSIEHMIDKPELCETRDDVAEQFLKMIGVKMTIDKEFENSFKAKIKAQATE